MLVYLKLVLTMAFWGGTWVAGRLVAQSLHPFSAAFLRFLLASGVMLLVTARAEGRLPRISRRDLPGIICLGSTGIFLYNWCFFSGLATVTAGRSALIVASIPALIAVYMALVHKERFGALRAGGVALSLSGVATVVSGGDIPALLAQGVSRGDLYIFGGVISWAAYTLAGKRVMARLSPLTAVTWSCVAGCVMLLPAALIGGLVEDLARAGAGDWLNLAYLAVLGTGAAFSWYYQGIREIGASRAGVFINLVPVFGVSLGHFILGEPMSLSILLGGAMVLTGVYLTNRPR